MLPRDRFDVSVLLVILALLASIAVVIVRGDQIGLGVRSFGPVNSASSQAEITINFDEPIDPAVAAQHITFTPLLKGTFSASGSQLYIRPDLPLQPGQTYAVTVQAGMPAVSGRTTRQDVHWQFQVRQPRLLYLGPADQVIQNLFVVSSDGHGKPQQLTNSENGVVGFDVTPDGSKIVYSEIAYSEQSSYGVTQLFLFDLATGASRLLYNCNAVCTNLTWRPDGGAVAFQKVELNESVGTGPGAPRIWLFDLSTNAAQPLFSDNQKIGYSPHWSPDGTRLAFYSPPSAGIVVHNFSDNHDLTVPAPDGEIGSFSPDGHWLYFPKVVTLADGNIAVHFMVANLIGDTFSEHDLDRPDDPVNEVEAVWRADSEGLIVSRQPSVNTPTAGTGLYNVDLATGDSTVLVPDDGNNQDHLVLSPAGDSLLFQRVPQGNTTSLPQVWLYNFSSKALKQITDNVTTASWLP